MNGFKLLLEEIRYRKLNFALCVLAVMVTTTLFVAAPTLVDAYGQFHVAELKEDEDKTRKNMLKLDFNLLIVHKDADMTEFWTQDAVEADMPQEYVDRLAQSKLLSNVRHIVPRLKKQVQLDGRTVLLVGEMPEVTQTHFGQKKAMGFVIRKRGEAHLGYDLHDGGKRYQEGQQIEVNGTPLTITKLLDQKGTKDDSSLAVNLADAQQILGKPERVSEILALGCNCAADKVGVIREQLTTALDGQVKITADMPKFFARAEQRQLARNRVAATQEHWSTVLGYSIPLLVAICAVFVGLFTLANVRERTTEVGVLRALGKPSLRIAGLFIAKALVIGVVGGILGVAAGTLGAVITGESLLAISRQFLNPNLALVAGALVGAPLVCAMAAYLPTLVAISQDPAVVLQDR